MFGAFVMMVIEHSGSHGAVYGGATEVVPLDSSDIGAKDAEVGAVRSAAEGALGKMAGGDAGVVALVEEKAEGAFESSTGYTLTDLGIDPAEFSAWLMEDLTFSIGDNDAYAHSDGVGLAFATVEGAEHLRGDGGAVRGAFGARWRRGCLRGGVESEGGGIAAASPKPSCGGKIRIVCRARLRARQWRMDG